ncbi:MAG: hypothetical protein DMG17_28870 [Acidobacteria bacterium]|nr:MAG: hypothetical protein AUI91_04380 [Acidobacteria bacterium 13_1_40CM_3_56_11]PYS08455.1 MAG: hypothetical protein DMG17_28870 [Acidobacteriota bacterium]
MLLSRYCRIIAVAAALCLLPIAVLGQEFSPIKRNNNAPPKPSGATPRTPDGHPDLTGVWNGLGDNLLGVPNQIANNGLSIESESATRDLHSGASIATFPRNTNRPLNNEQAERAATLLRRVGSNRPIYKPEYWEMVKNLDANANEEDPSNNCMPAGIPRAGIPSYIGQFPNYFIFIYPGQGGLIATQTMYRMIPSDGRKHTPLQELDGTYTGEGIAHWDGETLVVDTWGFNSNTWFDQLGGYFHSENMHVIERFHRDGNTLTWTATVEDPDVLVEPWTTTPRVALLNPKPGAMLPESQPCSERDLSHIVTKEHH